MTTDAATGDEACLNIGPRQRQRRLRFGLATLALGLVAFALLYHYGAARPWRLTLLVPFVLAGYGYFQAREKT